MSSLRVERQETVTSLCVRMLLCLFMWYLYVIMINSPTANSRSGQYEEESSILHMRIAPAAAAWRENAGTIFSLQATFTSTFA